MLFKNPLLSITLPLHFDTFEIYNLAVLQLLTRLQLDLNHSIELDSNITFTTFSILYVLAIWNQSQHPVIHYFVTYSTYSSLSLE